MQVVVQAPRDVTILTKIIHQRKEIRTNESLHGNKSFSVFSNPSSNTGGSSTSCVGLYEFSSNIYYMR